MTQMTCEQVEVARQQIEEKWRFLFSNDDLDVSFKQDNAGLIKFDCPNLRLHIDLSEYKLDELNSMWNDIVRHCVEEALT